MTHATTATTRTMRPSRRDPARHLLGIGQEIASPETLLRYRIGELLGEGGSRAD